MKKIFTLIFSLGLLTSVFAQSEHRQQKQPQDNGYQTSPYSHSGHQDKNSSNAYSNGRDNQWNSKDNNDQYAYSHNERNDSYRGRDEHFSPKYNGDKRIYDRGEHHQPATRVSLLQIIFGIGGR